MAARAKGGIVSLLCGNCGSDDIVVNEIKWNRSQGTIVTAWCRNCRGIASLEPARDLPTRD